MKYAVFLLAGLLFLTACPMPDNDPNLCNIECDYPEELLYNFGFEDVTVQQEATTATIGGTDQGFPSHNNWDDFLDNPEGELWINYQEGNATDRLAEIVPDPEDPSNSVLKFNINKPHITNNFGVPEKARVQMNFYNKECLREYYQTCKVYLPQASMDHLRQYDGFITWLSIFEFWNNANWTNEGNAARINVTIGKDKNPGDPLFFRARAEKAVGNNFDTLWDHRVLDYPVPVGQWMEIELYLLEGDEQSGRFYMAVTPEGGSKEVIFDIYDITQYPDEDCPDGFKHLQVLKWYTSEAIASHMESGGVPLDIYWDDVVVERNRVP